MSDIDYADKGGLLNPLKSLLFFARKPVTESLDPRPASANYRGFHVNDWETCIGCSACQKVCDNAAISMVKIPSLPEDPVKGIRNRSPGVRLRPLLLVRALRGHLPDQLAVTDH